MTIAQHNQQIDQAIDSVLDLTQTQLTALLTEVDQVLVQNPEGDITAAVSVALLALGLISSDIATVTTELLRQYADLMELEFDNATGTTLSTAVAQTIDSETESLAQEIVAAVIIGRLIGNSRTQINQDLKRIRDQGRRAIGITITESIMTAHGAFGYTVARLAGFTRFQYVGGTISTTRPFCQTHNGKTYTATEIKQIWRGSWGGKKPGNPFAVRGGYNCRHYWIPQR